MKTNKLKYIVLSAVFFLIGTVNIFANGAPSPSGLGGIPGVPGDDDEPVSIDQAMIWLLIAAIFVALYFLQAKKIANTEK